MTELVTISTPEFLFEFIEEQTGEEYYCILSDTSLYNTRYNQFSITDGTDINFPIDGYYTYKVYEQAVSGSLDPTGKNVVEEGRAYVYVVDPSRTEYTDDTETDTVYEES